MLCGFREFYTLHSTWETDDMTMVERTTQLNAMQSMKKFFIIGVVSQQVKEAQLFIEASTSNFKRVTFIYLFQGKSHQTQDFKATALPKLTAIPNKSECRIVLGTLILHVYHFSQTKTLPTEAPNTWING